MNEQQDMDCPLVDITKTLRDVPNRDVPCDREITDDGIQIVLNDDTGDELRYD